MNELMNNEIPEETEEYLIPEEEQHFTPQDDAGAEWCLAKIREANAEIEKWEAHYAHELDRVKKRQGARIQWMEQLLSGYFRRVPHKATKTQESYSLPGGKLILKKQGPEFDAKGPDFIAWLKKNKLNEFVEVKESAKWGEFKKTLLKTPEGQIEIVKDEAGIMRPVTEDGEIVDGVTVTPRDDIFKVEVK